MNEDTDIRPTHVWVKRTLYLRGQDSQVKNEIVEFDDLTDQGMAKTFIEILLDIGHELGVYTDFSPVKMDVGRYVIQSDQGFSVVEIDPAWTEEQIAQMERETAEDIDWKVWGDIFSKEDVA